MDEEWTNITVNIQRPLSCEGLLFHTPLDFSTRLEISNWPMRWELVLFIRFLSEKMSATNSTNRVYGVLHYDNGFEILTRVQINPYIEVQGPQAFVAAEDLRSPDQDEISRVLQIRGLVDYYCQVLKEKAENKTFFSQEAVVRLLWDQLPCSVRESLLVRHDELCEEGR